MPEPNEDSEFAPDPSQTENVRELIVKTDQGEDVSIIILDNPNLLPPHKRNEYASAIERISSRDIISKESALDQFRDYQSRRWYFLVNPHGQIASYGTVHLQRLESGEQDCYISKIATERLSRGKGYATAILDTIVTDGFDRIWTFNAIAGTPEGDAMRRMHEGRGFTAKEPPGVPANLYWKRTKK